jgi:hypothetical protein
VFPRRRSVRFDGFSLGFLSSHGNESATCMIFSQLFVGVRTYCYKFTTGRLTRSVMLPYCERL